MIPGYWANWRRTSSTTRVAVTPTAASAYEENKNTSIAPRSAPTKTGGLAKSIVVKDLSADCSLTTSMKARKSRNDARPAEPTEYPFVIAFVTLPTASRESVIARTCAGACDISAMPPELSQMGPKTSAARTYTALESIPMVATAVPKSPPPGIADSPRP
eukprot:Amastigsp_a842912_29.p3 type:complete len:160 gc:universal Amastigsp_a842912_29:2139-1660(-)